MSLTPDELYALALDADRQLLGPDAGTWLDRLARERPALDELLERYIAAGDSEHGLTLAGALARFWWMRGHTTAGRERMGRVLALTGGSNTARAASLVGAGSLAYAAGDFRTARALHERAFPLLRAAGSELDLAGALDQAGMAARQLMELEDASALHAEALAIQQRSGAPAARALCLNNLGVVAFFRGDLPAARSYHEEALALRERSGDRRGQASSLNNLGQIDRFGGDLPSSFARIEQGLELRRELGDRWGVAGSQVNLSMVCTGMRELVLARTHLREAAASFRALGDPLGICECLDAAADLAHAEGRLPDAVSFIAAASLRRERLPAPRSPLLERAVAERMAELRAAIGDAACEHALEEGRGGGEGLVERIV